MTRVPRLLLLGGGAVVRELYIPALDRLGWLAKAAVIERSPEGESALRRVAPQVRVHQNDFHDILRSPCLHEEYDGVIVALPNQLHEEAVIGALNRRLPVLCEKPLGLDAESCRRVAAASHRCGTAVMVGMVRRLVPSARAIAGALRSRLIGELVRAEIEHGGRFTWPSDSGGYFIKENGGALLNMGVHYLDLVEHWLGTLGPSSYKDDYAGGVEANFDYRLTTASGVPVRVAASYTHTLRNRIVLTGNRGTISASVNDLANCEWESDAGLRGTLTPRTESISSNRSPDLADAFVDQIRSFADVIAGHGRPLISAEQTVHTLELIDWAMNNRESLRPRRAGVSIRRPTLPPANSVVTGGTGFVGTHLVARLNELGFPPVTVPIRSHRTGAALGCFPANRVLADLLSYEEVRRAVAGSRYVFHLAYGADGPRAKEVTVKGTRNVVEAAIEEKAEVVVVVSTTTVFGHTVAEGVVDESSPYRPDLGKYGASKAAAEQYSLRRANSSGSTRIVVLNPSSIYGPGGSLFTEFPARSAQLGQFCWVDDGRGNLNYTFVDNLVDALLLAAHDPQAHGQRFIISDGTCSIREFLAPMLGPWAETLPSMSRADLLASESANKTGLRDLARTLSSDHVVDVLRRMPIVGFARDLARVRLHRSYESARLRWRRTFETTPRRTAKSVNPPAWLADVFGPMRIVCSADKAKALLGWTPIIQLAEGQRLSVDWLRQLGVLETEERHASDFALAGR